MLVQNQHTRELISFFSEINLKQNESQSARAESTHKGVNLVFQCVICFLLKRGFAPKI